MANLALWKHPRGRAGVTGAFASLAQSYRDLLHGIMAGEALFAAGIIRIATSGS
jgi:hypothetical protein